MLLTENEKKLKAAGWNEGIKFFYRNPNSNYVIVTSHGFAILHKSNLKYGKHLAKFFSVEVALEWIENNERVS